MRNKNYIDRIFLRLSTIFTIIKSFALLSIKKKKPYLSHKYPISKWFGTSLHQKEIKKIRPNPPKYPSILFPNFSTFILIQTLALLPPTPFRKPSPLQPLPSPIQSFHEESIADIQYPTSIPNFPPRMSIPYIERGGGKQETILDARSHAEYDGWNTSERRDASKVMPCHVVDIWIARGPNRSRG